MSEAIVPFDPLSLPIYDHEDEIIAAVRNHRVVVVEGATGSGKTTQLPRILLKADLHGGLIGITQPRRIAATSVARRLAEEEGVALGEEVGYAIRFDDRTSRHTMVKIMTDGILLQEARTDPDFHKYGTLIIDEAHERSLNIDLCLGLLHRALRQHPDLRVIVSSATLKPAEFQRYFQEVAGTVPLVSVSGRTYPVTIRHRAPDVRHWSEVPNAIAGEILRIHKREKQGHILAFLTGQGMIERTVQAIEDANPGPGLVVLPLYARLTRDEQERIFDVYGDKRKAIIATNIAETSITIPGVRYVVDCGLAKVPRFDPRTGITTLREERISRASAEQRAGRAGRTSSGKVMRLYEKRDLERQPEFTDEEIRRLDLSEVVLRLIDLGVPDVEHFEFPTKPAPSQLKAAIASLQTMGAIDGQQRLTEVGRRMVPFPLGPPLARMVVEAATNAPQVLEETLLVAAFMSSRPPFLYPLGEEVEARRAKQRLAHDSGDTVTAIDTALAFRDASNRKAFCTQNYLDPDVMAFVLKAHRQLVDIAETRGMEIKSGGRKEEVIRCLAMGYPERILVRRGRSFITLTGERMAIHPSSTLYRTDEPLLVAAELVISGRSWARHCSVLDRGWLYDINPEAARTLKVRGKRRKGAKAAPVEQIPREVMLGGVKLEVKRRGKKPRVYVPIERAAEILAADHSHLTREMLRWPATLVSKQGRFGGGTTLGRLLRQLPVTPLPAPDQKLDRNMMEGVVLDVEINWPTIEPLLGRLLEPMLPGHGKRPGWLTLVANGMAEYWFEVVHDLPGAVQTSVLSLEELERELGLSEDEDKIDRFKAKLASLEKLARELGG